MAQATVAEAKKNVYQHFHRTTVVELHTSRPTKETVIDFLHGAKASCKGRYCAVLQQGDQREVYHLHVGVTTCKNPGNWSRDFYKYVTNFWRDKASCDGTQQLKSTWKSFFAYLKGDYDFFASEDQGFTTMWNNSKDEDLKEAIQKEEVNSNMKLTPANLYKVCKSLGVTNEEEWKEKADINVRLRWLNASNFPTMLGQVCSLIQEDCLKQSYWDLLCTWCQEHQESAPEDEKDAYRGWMKLDELITANCNTSMFCADLIDVMDCHEGKINAFVLQGPSNTGKMLICRLVSEPVMWGRIDNNQNFPFGDCINKRVLFHDEPEITAGMAQQYKQVMGGKTTKVNVKYRSLTTVQSNAI